MENAIVFAEKSRRKNNKYDAEEITYRARINPEQLPQDVRGVPMTIIVNAVQALFEALIRRTTETLAPTDLIRFCILAEGLDKPISTSLMTVSEVTVERLLSNVIKVLQSNEHIALDSDFSVDIVTIRRPVGGGGNRRVLNISMDRLKKRSVLSIPYDAEGLCCAKAIVFALAHLEQDRTAINAMRNHRRPALMNRARILHETARVPLGPCTYSEIKKFEDHLNVQIVVFSSENLNKVSIL